MSDLDAGEDMFDDFLNSRLEDDETIGHDQSVADAINDDEFEKLLNESETETVQNEPEKESINVDLSSATTITASTESVIEKKEEQVKDDEEVIEFSWSDEDYSKDETDQVNQNNVISEIKIQQEKPVTIEKSENWESNLTNNASNSTTTDQGTSVKSEEIIETRISVMISDVLNRFGKVIDIDSRSEAIENRIKHLKEEEVESEYSFGKLKGSIQRKLVVLECAVENLCVLVEKNVQRKLKLRESKQVLKEQLRANIEKYSEKCTQLDEQKEKYSKMENLWEKDRKNLVDLIEKLKQQVESKDPENEFLKTMKIPEAPKATDSEDNTLSNLTKSLLSLPEAWKSSNPSDSNPQSSNTSSSSSADPNKVDPLAKASSWFSSWMNK